MQAGWNVTQCSYSAYFSVEEEDCLFGHCSHPADLPSTGVVCTASGATSPLYIEPMKMWFVAVEVRSCVGDRDHSAFTSDLWIGVADFTLCN